MVTQGLRLFRHPLDLPADARGAVVAIGNFDGVHLGHRAVIETAGRLAREQGRPWAVMTFEPHPHTLFRPDIPPYRLTPFREKVRHLEALGIDILIVAHFDRDFAMRTAAQFFEQTLMTEVGAAHLVAGADFRFGHDRSGDIACLGALGAPLGVGATAVDPFLDDTGEPYSSTRVRAALRNGDPRLATRLMGRAWEIEGRVDRGAQLGRTLGFPTANIDLAEYMRPKYGVYAVRAGIDKGRATVWHDGVANLGKRPTVDGLAERFEVHLFDFDRDVYGHHLRVQMIDYLRPEVKFSGVDALKAQIAEDVGRAKAILAG